MREIQVIGAGPAGAAAAMSALREGSGVRLVEKSRFPRHKVCGEFLSPEVEPVLKSLGAWDGFLAARPAIIRRLELNFQGSGKRCSLPGPAWGLSRYRLDELLFRGAVSRGAVHAAGADSALSMPTVIAHGRSNRSTRGGRIFGFKAHFEGPVHDAVELFFFAGCYVGINPVENGITNVCGLGPEHVLHARDFDIDRVVQSCANLVERLRPMTRRMKWLTAGPLVFQNHFRDRFAPGAYPAGDALSFVDPFTGSGMLSALVSGRLAGIAASRGTPVDAYVAECRRRLDTPFRFSALIRKMLANGWAEPLAGLVPGNLLVWFTRPHQIV